MLPDLSIEEITDFFMGKESPESVKESVDNWFMCYVSNKLPGENQSAHRVNVEHYKELKELLTLCANKLSELPPVPVGQVH